MYRVNFLTGWYQGRQSVLMTGMRRTTSDPANIAAAKVLRAVLAEHNVPQTAIAEALDVDNAQLSRWLNAKKGQVPIKVLLAVSDATRVSAGELMRRIDNEYKSGPLVDPRDGMSGI